MIVPQKSTALERNRRHEILVKSRLSEVPLPVYIIFVSHIKRDRRHCQLESTAATSHITGPSFRGRLHSATPARGAARDVR